ncbi:MAG: hypothetical protein GX879_01660 [Bacteroidales bacterium]|nr:hypothetical protein [Bacteroidales bacterium]
MKKLSEMKIAKEAILSSVEADAKGGNAWGSNTSYVGPAAPTQLWTDFVGNPDPYSGRMYGDWWRIDDSMADPFYGMISIKPL